MHFRETISGDAADFALGSLVTCYSWPSVFLVGSMKCDEVAMPHSITVQHVLPKKNMEGLLSGKR